MKTVKLKEICNTLSNFVQYVAVRPITDLVAIVAKNGTLYIGHTDKDNATIVATLDYDKEFPSTVVKLSDLTKIVKATTVEEIELDGKENYLEFIGNGKYKVPIQLDETGNKINLPISMPSMGESFHIKDIERVYKRNDNFIDKTDALPAEFDVYYCDGKQTVTTNSIILAITNYNTQITEISPAMMKSLTALPKEFDMSKVDGGYRIAVGCYRAYYRTRDNDSFPVDTVMPLVNNLDVYTNDLNITKKDFLSCLKRQEIFKTGLYEPILYLTFGSNSITIENKEQTFYETIPCDGNGDNKKLQIRTKNMLSVVRLMEDDITIHLASKFVCLEDTIGRYIISCVEEE